MIYTVNQVSNNNNNSTIVLQFISAYLEFHFVKIYTYMANFYKTQKVINYYTIFISSHFFGK